jgi:hypothetical protein
MEGAERLRSAGLRVTAARLAILDAIGPGRHPAVEYWTSIHPDLGGGVAKGLNGG